MKGESGSRYPLQEIKKNIRKPLILKVFLMSPGVMVPHHLSKFVFLGLCWAAHLAQAQTNLILEFFMIIDVKSADAAWDLLSQIISGELEIESLNDLDFGDWINSSVIFRNTVTIQR